MTNEQKQHLLACLGYYTGIVDGIWGEQSRAATIAVQRAAGLEEDGDFGDKTLSAALDLIGKKQFAQPEPEPEPDPAWPFKWIDRETELRCRCGGKYCNGFPAEPDHRVVAIAEQTREHFGLPVDISSGLRCPTWNSLQPGAVSNSFHQFGRALDFRIRGKSSQETLDYVLTLDHVNYAYMIDDEYIHVDVAEAG